MSPDDPRHGTHAGAVQHFKEVDSLTTCSPCRVAYSRYRKALRHTHYIEGRRRVQLGVDAWQVLDICTPSLVAESTGISAKAVVRLHNGGPAAGVLRATRAVILDRRPDYSPLGIQRRLQALAAIGYSSPMVSDHIQINPTTLNRIRTREVQFVRSTLARRVVAVYDALQDLPVNEPTSSAAARNEARRGGWVPPMAWDDIDYDIAPPVGIEPGLDDVAIERALSGDRGVHLTLEEKHAAAALWQRRGNSLRELEYLTGWRADRYVSREEVAAA